MRHRTHRASRGPRRSNRGATITEYAIILFVVAVVVAGGFRVFGAKLQGGVGAAGNDLEASSEGTAGGGQAGGGGAGGGLTTSHGAGATAGGGGDTSTSYGGARVPITPTEGTPFAKFAMIALGIIGAAAAFFAAMKGKNAR